MDEHEWLAEQFEAYRMLGDLTKADDAVQESWLHLSRSDTSGVENLGGWLTTVVAQVCLDMLRKETRLITNFRRASDHFLHFKLCF